MNPINIIGDQSNEIDIDKAIAEGEAFSRKVAEESRKARLEARLKGKPAKEVKQPSTAPEMKGSIYVPSIKLYLAKERTLQGKSWN